jgi:hypothetical protein
MIRPARIALLAIVSIAPPLHAQTPVPQATFRGGTDLVQVDVSVLDGKRHPVRGLTAGDFTIFEDGESREIQAFTEVSLPDRVQLRSTIVDAGGAVVATQTSALEAAQFSAGRTAEHYVTVPLATLAPGDYLLKIETTMGLRTAGRAMRFIVKP